MSEKIEGNLGLREEFIPEVVGEGFTDAGQNREEVGFEGLDGMFGKVAAMNVWRYELIGSFPILGDGVDVLRAGFVVEHLVIYSVAACLKSGHKARVGWDVVSVVAGLERFD